MIRNVLRLSFLLLAVTAAGCATSEIKPDPTEKPRDEAKIKKDMEEGMKKMPAQYQQRYQQQPGAGS